MSGANVFISYTGVDLWAAEPLRRRLLESGNYVFMFQATPAVPGTSFPAHVTQNLALCHLVILLWSRHAAMSAWVAAEIQCAQQWGKYIIPVMLDPAAQAPPQLVHLQAIQAYQDPAGWVMQVSDAINLVVAWWHELRRQASQQQAEQAAREAKSGGDMLQKVVGGVIGAGVAAALIGALTSSED